MKLTLLSVLLSSIVASAVEITPLPQKFVRAIHQVESGGRLGAISGDRGAAKGPLQIHRAYWQDAVSYDRTIGGKYEDCADLAYSVRVMTAYLNRYQKAAVKNGNLEILARTHNGGLNGAKKAATVGYWGKVAKYL